MIIRSRREHNYTIVPNDMLEYCQLTWGAKGLLTFLLSCPDNWDVSYRQLATVGCDGEHVTRRLLRELEAAGYIVRERTRDGANKIRWESIVYDTPQTRPAACTAEPTTNEPGEEEPCGDLSCGDSPRMEEPCGDLPCADSPRMEVPCGDLTCGEKSCGKSPGVADRRQISTLRTITTTKATTRASSPDGEGTPPKPAIFDAALNDAQRETRADPSEFAPSASAVSAGSGRAKATHPPTEHEQLFGAVCWLIGWESATLAREQRSQVAQTVGILKRAGYGIDDLRRFWTDVWLSDWRWRKEKARPTLTILRAEIGKLRVDERDLEGGTRGEEQIGNPAVNAELREQLRDAKRRRAAAHATPSEGLRLPDLQGQAVGLPGCADGRPTLRQGVPLPLPGAGGQGEAVAVAAGD
jgi:hypothetical protein